MQFFPLSHVFGFVREKNYPFHMLTPNSLIPMFILPLSFSLGNSWFSLSKQLNSGTLYSPYSLLGMSLRENDNGLLSCLGFWLHSKARWVSFGCLHIPHPWTDGRIFCLGPTPILIFHSVFFFVFLGLLCYYYCY